MRLILIVLASWSCTFGASEYKYSENIVEALERAKILWNQGKTEDSLIEFENVLLLDRTHLEGLTGVFQCQLRLDLLEDARHSLEFIDKYSLDRSRLRKLARQLDEAERAQDQLAARKFFEEENTDFEPATHKKDPQKKPLKISPAQVFQNQSPQGRFAKAIQLHKKGFSSQAIPIYMEAIMDNPDLLFANDHGLLFASRNFYTQELESNPKNIKVIFILAWLWEHYSQDQKAENLYQNISELAPKNSREFQVAQAKLQALKERKTLLKEQKFRAEQGLQRDQERFHKLQIANGKYKKYAPKDYREKGLKYLEDKDIPQAIIHLQGAIRIEPSNPQAHYYYAMAQVESAFQGNENGFSIAKRQLEKTLSLDPEPILRRKAQELLNTLTTQEEKSLSPTSP